MIIVRRKEWEDLSGKREKFLISEEVGEIDKRILRLAQADFDRLSLVERTPQHVLSQALPSEPPRFGSRGRQQAVGAQPPGGAKCAFCGHLGHTEAECRKKRTAAAAAANGGKRRPEPPAETTAAPPSKFAKVSAPTSTCVIAVCARVSGPLQQMPPDGPHCEGLPDEVGLMTRD